MARGPRGAGTGIDLVVLGCDGSWPGPHGAGSGYLVLAGADRVMLDAGPGTFAALQDHLDPAMVDAVVISHAHADHWTDLCVMATHAGATGRRHRLAVYAPSGMAERAGLRHHRALEWHEVAGGDRRTVGVMALTFRRTDHAVATLAVRVEANGRVLGYTADTGPGWDVGELGGDIDLLLCEATTAMDGEATGGHLSGRQAGAGARRAGVGHLVLTHRRPTVDASTVAGEAAASFGRAVDQATPGARFAV